MANENNLIPATQGGYKFTREDCKKGGINSAKSRREQKKLKEIINILLSKRIKAKGAVQELEELESLANAKNANLTAKEMLGVNMLIKAIDGDIKATEFIVSMIGEKPKEDNSQEEVVPVVILGGDEILE